DSAASMIGPITLGAKRAGEPDAGNPHVRFDRAGVGDGLTGAANRAPKLETAETAKPHPTEYCASPRPYLDALFEGRKMAHTGVVSCPICGMRVFPGADQLCPSCRAYDFGRSAP